jgi:hypothetical protein
VLWACKHGIILTSEVAHHAMVISCSCVASVDVPEMPEQKTFEKSIFGDLFAAHVFPCFETSQSMQGISLCTSIIVTEYAGMCPRAFECSGGPHITAGRL